MRSLSLFLLFVCRNCLFRALGDQLEGHSRGHLRLRQETVQYMSSHRQDFEPFVEDDVPFAQHCEKMNRSEIQTRSSTERKACDQIRGFDQHWYSSEKKSMISVNENFFSYHFDQQLCADPWWPVHLLAMDILNVSPKLGTSKQLIELKKKKIFLYK